MIASCSAGLRAGSASFRFASIANRFEEQILASFPRPGVRVSQSGKGRRAVNNEPKLVHVRTATLDIACEIAGPERGAPVILLHGFPDDVRTWDGAVTQLAAAGYRTIAPYLRGYGPTRFLDEGTLRSGQQAALGKDLLHLMDALRIGRAALVGYDWGGRAACVVSALWPERARALVSIGGYNVLNAAANAKPLPPAQEHRLWYQWYFSTERGRAGLAANRRDFC